MNVAYSVAFILCAINFVGGCVAPRQGCYAHNNRMEHILFSNKAEHTGKSYHEGEIDWTNYERYFQNAICECEKAAAAKGYGYFSFRHFGECHGIKSIETLTRVKGMTCFRDFETMCEDKHEKCFGADDDEFIYKVQVAPEEVKDACSGFLGKYHGQIIFEKSGGNKIEAGYVGKGRPYKGEMTEHSTSKCSGWILFPGTGKITFEYETKTCRLLWGNKDIWENDKCENNDIKTDACEDMSAHYGKNIPLKVLKDRKISGHINNRPRFQGEVTLATAEECRGAVNFPDDRVYSFVYDRKTCTVHWDGRVRNNKWKKPSCKGIDIVGDSCQDMAANYGRDIPLRVNKHRKISGHIRKRPAFKGVVTLASKHECRGYVDFPDDRRYYFDYERDSCTIHWDGRRSRNKWRKPSCSHCVGIAGKYYHHVDVTFKAKDLGGVIPGRPRFHGHVTVDTPTKCEGSMMFPDDRKYNFKYDASTCTITWEDNNVWQNMKCEQYDVNSDACLDMSAEYFKGTPLRVSRSRDISGHIGRRPKFAGKVTFVDEKECRGVVRFPDDRSYSFIYDRNTCVIHWDGKRSSNKWAKKCARRH